LFPSAGKNLSCRIQPLPAELWLSLSSSGIDQTHEPFQLGHQRIIHPSTDSFYSKAHALGNYQPQSFNHFVMKQILKGWEGALKATML